MRDARTVRHRCSVLSAEVWGNALLDFCGDFRPTKNGNSCVFAVTDILARVVLRLRFLRFDFVVQSGSALWVRLCAGGLSS
eukprot:1923035-Rhodomonas_salina.1